VTIDGVDNNDIAANEPRVIQLALKLNF